MPVCFVIMPFGPTTENHTKEYWDEHFTRFIKPAVEAAAEDQKRLGYEAKRADARGGAISDDVFRNLLQEADVVLADLTDSSPNVMYELGIRHCVGDRTILIIERGQEQTIPFYLKNYRVISYSGSSPRDTNDFYQNIQQRLLDIQHTDPHSDNPVYGYLQTKAQKIKLFSNQEWENYVTKLQEISFSAMYTPGKNTARNARKGEVIREAKQYIRLLASSGHAYLVMYGHQFRRVLQERLRDSVSVQIILENPWSTHRVLLTLSELREDKPPLKSIQKEALERFKQGNFRGFDPVELIEQSNHYTDKYLPSLRGYGELEQQFGNKIELRISTYPVVATVLLTEAVGFFEPIGSREQTIR